MSGCRAAFDSTQNSGKITADDKNCDNPISWRTLNHVANKHVAKKEKTTTAVVLHLQKQDL
ncbi:hypothetical protein ACTXIZ_09710 [Psychrobacter celer]|uniref:hypothetical protein n=1 Tax=Psychrobacter celer TaxID=306572 RepID=UPI003FD5E0CA